MRQQQKCLAAKELFHQMLHASASRRWMALKRICPNMRSLPNIRKITRKLPSNQVNILERVFHAKEFAGLNTISSVAEAIYQKGVCIISSELFRTVIRTSDDPQSFRID